MVCHKSVLTRAVVLGLVTSAVLAAPRPHYPDNDVVSQQNVITVPYRSFLPSDFKSYGDWAVAEMSSHRNGWRSVKSLLDGVWHTLTSNRGTMVQPRPSFFSVTKEGIDVVEIKGDLKMTIPGSTYKVAIPFDLEVPISPQGEIATSPSQDVGESVPPHLEEAMRSIENVLGRESPWYGTGSTTSPSVQLDDLKAWNGMLEKLLGTSSLLEHRKVHAPTFVKRSSLAARSPEPQPVPSLADGPAQNLEKRWGLLKLFHLALKGIHAIDNAVHHRHD